MAIQGSLAQPALIGIPEIARIAHVGPSAVGNWRKRHAEFPTPKMQTPSGALFDLDEVEKWLVENGKMAGRAPASARLWALTDSARRIWRPDQVSSFCIASLVYLEACERAEAGGALTVRHAPVVPAEASWAHVRDEDRPAEFVRLLRRAADRIEELNQELSGLLAPGFSHVRPSDGGIARNIAVALDGATEDVNPRSSLLEEVTPKFESVRETPRGRLSRNALANLTEADRFSAEYSTPDEISYLLSQLVGTADGTIFDPAVGEGGLLLLAAMWRLDVDHPPKLVGIEINEAVRRITRSRCYLYELPADIRLGNALAMDLSQLPKADSVVLDPPYARSDWGDADLYLDPRWIFGPPPPKSADFAWLQVAVMQLKPGGRAGVVLPAGSLFRGGREAAIRRALIEAGTVECVVLLPPRLRADTSIPLSVWLLRAPDAEESADEILLVDASDLGKPGRSRFSLEEETIDRLGQLVENWRLRREIDNDDDKIAVAVPIRSITDANLNPRRYQPTPQIDVVALERRARELEAKVQDSVASASEALAQFSAYLEG
jgi:type I restriction enzyme M protein